MLGCHQPHPHPGWTELSPLTTIPAPPPGHLPCNTGLILWLICASCCLLGHPSSGATSPYTPLLKTLGSTQNPDSPKTQKTTLEKSQECLGLHLRGRGMQEDLPQALCSLQAAWGGHD